MIKIIEKLLHHPLINDKEINDILHLCQSIINRSNKIYYYKHDTSHIFQALSHSVAYMLGYPPDELIGVSYLEILTDHPMNFKIREITQLSIDTKQKLLPYPAELKHKNGSKVSVEIFEIPVTKDGKVVGVQGFAVDICHLSTTLNSFQQSPDQLSLLINRLIEQSNVNNTSLSVMYLNIDGFKKINKYLDNSCGNELLKQFSKKLMNTLSKSCYVMHYRGDEFIVVGTNVSNEESIQHTAQRIIKCTNHPFTLKNFKISLSISMGISMYPRDGEKAADLIKKAEIAMYRVKEEKKSNYVMYENSMSIKVYSKLNIESDLHRALRQNEFSLYYQPQINLQTKEIVGVEALLRWKHPKRGVISPGVFIPLAEETGLIEPIGDWVIMTACQQMKKWINGGIPIPRISINLSMRQFLQNNLIKKIEGEIKDANIDPTNLEVEITESMTMNVKQTVPILNALKSLGVSIAIDDFGKGYSSLNYLKDLPINKLKIDQIFIKDVNANSTSAAIVNTIISLAKNMNLNVTAEGIETQDQFEFLKEHHCEEGQGYLLGKPVPNIELERMLFNGL